MKPIDQLDHKHYEISDTWDWLARVTAWTWGKLSCEGFPNWDIVGENPPFVLLTMTRGSSDNIGESHRIASQFDDEAIDLFYYRDWTSSGIPFCSEEEKYLSGFWFKKQADAEAFQRKHGGIASWQPHFESKQREAFRQIGR